MSGRATSGVERLTTFCDGVYAIAITLLVLELRVPDHAEVRTTGLWHALGAHWSSFMAFGLSFLVIGIMWANHHNIFRYIAGCNHTFIMLNLALLFCTVVIPFPTAVLAAYLPAPEARTPATVLYGAVLTATALAYNGLWHYAVRDRRLLKSDADPRLVAGVTREYAFGPALYGAATLVALLSVWVSLAIHAALAGLYVVPNRSRP